MIPAEFDYVRSDTVDEAVRALAAGGEDPKVIAGGQSFIPVLRLRLATPSTVVDIGGIDELRGVRDDGDAIVVGAMTTHSEVVHDPLVAEYVPLLAQAAALVGDRQIRNRGTFGGALAHADPAGDLPAVALALDAEFVVAGPAGRRTVPASEFFVDYLTTALGADDVLVEIRLPKLPSWGARYLKFHRVAQAWAVVGVAAAVRRESGRIVGIRVALSSMAATPVRASGVERALTGGPPTAEAVAAAAEHAADGTNPTDDLNAHADYRIHLAGVLTRRAVGAAAGL